VGHVSTEPCLYVVCCLIWFDLTVMTPFSRQIYLTTCTTISDQDLVTCHWRNHISSPISPHQPPTSHCRTLHPSPPLQTNPSSTKSHPISQFHTLSTSKNSLSLSSCQQPEDITSCPSAAPLPTFLEPMLHLALRFNLLMIHINFQ
jgi:hypothetical protein